MKSNNQILQTITHKRSINTNIVGKLMLHRDDPYTSITSMRYRTKSKSMILLYYHEKVLDADRR
jgi:hypothetical protein